MGLPRLYTRVIMSTLGRSAPYQDFPDSIAKRPAWLILAECGTTCEGVLRERQEIGPRQGNSLPAPHILPVFWTLAVHPFAIMDCHTMYTYQANGGGRSEDGGSGSSSSRRGRRSFLRRHWDSRVAGILGTCGLNETYD